MLAQGRSAAVLAVVCVALLAPVALAAPSPVAQARKALAAGQLDQVLFALDGKSLSAAEKKEAAQVLARAGKKSLDGNDPLFALQFAQMALRDAPDEPAALEVGAQACLAEKQFTPAEQYADRWMKLAPKAPAASLLRAEIALTEGEWQHALDLTDAFTADALKGSERDRWIDLRKKARAELADRSAGLSTIQSLDQKLDDALAQSAALERQGKLAPEAPSTGVVLYGTSWCGFCRKAREYFTAHHIPFEDKDVEKDPRAAEELARKAAAQHLRPAGVPVIDINGQLVVGFDQPKIEKLLQL